MHDQGTTKSAIGCRTRILPSSRDRGIAHQADKVEIQLSRDCAIEIDRANDRLVQKAEHSLKSSKAVGSLSDDRTRPRYHHSTISTMRLNAKWIERFDTLGDADVAAIVLTLLSFARSPLYPSFVMPEPLCRLD